METQLINMGTFTLTVNHEGVFYKEIHCITQYVQTIDSIFNKVNFGFNESISNGIDKASYYFCIKDIILSKTGCEHTETTISQWIDVWKKYQELKYNHLKSRRSKNASK